MKYPQVDCLPELNAEDVIRKEKCVAGDNRVENSSYGCLCLLTIITPLAVGLVAGIWAYHRFVLGVG